MATINDLVSRIKLRLSRPDDASLNASCVSELVAAQERLENGTTLPWFLNTQASYEISGAHDSFGVSNFSGFLRIAEDDYAFRVEDLTRADEKLVKLQKYDTYEQLIQMYAGAGDETTLPAAYCVLGNTIFVRKTQVVTRKYYLSYFKKDVTIPAVDATTLWSTNMPDLLMAEAGIVMARYTRDTEALQMFMADRARSYSEMIKRNQAREDADQEYVMGE